MKKLEDHKSGGWRGDRKPRAGQGRGEEPGTHPRMTDGIFAYHDRG